MPRQGTSDKKGECQTCKGKLAECAGHYGAPPALDLSAASNPLRSMSRSSGDELGHAAQAT